MAKTGKCDFSELKKFAEHLEKQEIKAKAMIERCIKDLGKEVFKRAKKRTIVDTGNLEKAWTISSIKRVGNCYKVIVSNNLEYAAYVEYGHRTANHKKWVPGKFMLTISTKEVDKLTPATLERRMKRFLNQVMRYD